MIWILSFNKTAETQLVNRRSNDVNLNDVHKACMYWPAGAAPLPGVLRVAAPTCPRTATAHVYWPRITTWTRSLLNRWRHLFHCHFHKTSWSSVQHVNFKFFSLLLRIPLSRTELRPCLKCSQAPDYAMTFTSCGLSIDSLLFQYA